MTQQERNSSAQVPSTLSTSQVAALMGVSSQSVTRWASLSDDRGVALRKARLGRGRFSTATLREARLLT